MRAVESAPIPSPLRAVKRASGELELAILHAAQSGERAVRRGDGPTESELAEAAAAIAFVRATFARLGHTWEARARAAGPLPLAAVLAEAAALGGEGAR